jgi:hypothetical protein
MADKPASPIILEKIQFSPEESLAVLHARLSDTAPAFTNGDIARAATALHPDLPAHTCRNGCGMQLSDVLECTPLLHLFEHMIIDHLLEDLANGEGVYRHTLPEAGQIGAPSAGNKDFVAAAITYYTDTSKRRAQIKIRYVDDLALSRAVGAALDDMARIVPSGR